MLKFIVSVLIFMSSSIALASIFTEEAPDVLKYAEWLLGFLSLGIKGQAALYLTWFSTIMFGVMVLARALAEVLALFAAKTETTADDKALAFFSKTAKIAAKIVGWFGVGYPKILK